MRFVLLPLVLAACAPEPVAAPVLAPPLPAPSDAIPPSRVPVEAPSLDPIAVPDPRRTPVVTRGEPDTTATSDRDAIADVVKRSQGRITTCLDHSLRTSPTLNGKVSAGWTIAAGRVTEAHLVENTTGDNALGQCVVKSVRAFRFPDHITATVDEFPWVMAPPG